MMSITHSQGAGGAEQTQVGGQGGCLRWLCSPGSLGPDLQTPQYLESVQDWLWEAWNVSVAAFLGNRLCLYQEEESTFLGQCCSLLGQIPCPHPICLRRAPRPWSPQPAPHPGWKPGAVDSGVSRKQAPCPLCRLQVPAPRGAWPQSEQLLTPSIEGWEGASREAQQNWEHHRQAGTLSVEDTEGGAERTG